MGYIRAEDLSFIGADAFESDDGTQVSKMRVGNRVRVTSFDLETLCDALMSASNTLVP